MHDKRLARISVTYELLKAVLHLPDDVTIERVVEPRKDLHVGPVCEFVVSSPTNPGIPLVRTGEKIPEIMPIIHNKATFDWMELKPWP